MCSFVASSTLRLKSFRAKHSSLTGKFSDFMLCASVIREVMMDLTHAIIVGRQLTVWSKLYPFPTPSCSRTQSSVLVSLARIPFGCHSTSLATRLHRQCWGKFLCMRKKLKFATFLNEFMQFSADSYPLQSSQEWSAPQLHSFQLEILHSQWFRSVSTQNQSSLRTVYYLSESQKIKRISVAMVTKS